jgi:methylated-DNA-[protein]-cysteine S-methyltransferase
MMEESLPVTESGWIRTGRAPHIQLMTAEQPSTHHHIFDTALGPCGVAWNARGLVGVQLPEAGRAATENRLAARTQSAGATEPPVWVAALVADIRRYLAGERVDFSAVAVDLSVLEPFRRRLYETMRALAWGSTTTYGALAREIGLAEPEAARDVGEAMGKNPVPIVIPCHRVLAAGGKLGGFSAHGGAATKAKLLALEGVHLDGGAPRLPGL